MKGGFFLSSMNNSALKMKCNHVAFALIKCLSEKKQLVTKLPVLAAMLNMVSGYLHGVDGFLHVCVANPVLASEKRGRAVLFYYNKFFHHAKPAK